MDQILSVNYYDFSKTHADFDDISYVSVSDPQYVASPYGAWLSASSNPVADTFSTWYRQDWSVNQMISNILILYHQSGTIKRWVWLVIGNF